jgi:60 kDa SS-A/Ro ribonucleoprotein
MRKNAYTGFNTRMTPQTEPIPGENQIRNNAGGYVYDVGTFKRFERFLVLGSEGGTYYVGEAKLTKENALNTIAAIEADGDKAVQLIRGVSDSGRAVKNDAAIFALALAASAKNPQTRKLALAALPAVCRIPTHLFHFLTYVKQFRGFGRGLKRAVGEWYQAQPVEKLAYQVVKYQSRDGWSNADALRLSHPKTQDAQRNFVYRWIVDGIVEPRRSLRNFHRDSPDCSGFEIAKDYRRRYTGPADHGP